MVKILINEAFKKYLIHQPAAFRRKVRQKFEYLEIGYWDGGLKVKKIKGVSSTKAVFEARLDRANRLLFTLGTEYDGDQPVLLVFVWGIVGHDDIAAGSRRIPTDVPFLQFKPLQELSLDEANIEELSDEYRTQESITQKIADDSATQKWHFLDKANWDRIEKYQQDEFEMELYLTPEQRAILNRPLPVLVSGTAGSGKTTLSVYYLLKLPLAKHKKLFITYNKYLRNAAFRLYHGLLNSSALKDEYVAPDFFTFKGYCLDIIAHFNRSFPPEKEVNFDRFYQLALSHAPARRFDLPLIWEEIRSIIKGALPQINLKLLKTLFQQLEKGVLNGNGIQALQQQFLAFARLESMQRVAGFVQKYLNTDIETFSKNPQYYIEENRDRVLSVLDKTINWLEKQRELTQKKYLSFADYEALGRKKAPHFHLDRKPIYQVFEWYQDRLDAEGLWDELDLTREVINLLSERNPEPYRYDIVVCDEVQDLTDVQHELLFYIVRDPRNLILSGDTKQIINPSGFRWEELKRHFYERDLPVPEIAFLSLNFRSSGSIVELSNILLELKAKWLGVRAEELKEEWKYKGRPPIIVNRVSEERMLQSMQITGARKTILVRNPHEKERLQKLLDTELVFTINEAKGLEFDTVLLWKFASDLATRDVWKAILQAADLDVHQAKIRHEVNLLYVAITRAQKDLLVYDGEEPSLIWQSEPIRDHVYLTEDIGYVDEVWNVVSTPEEWREQGDYFFEREYYRAAMECYKNAGDEEAHRRAKAFDAEKRQDWKLAAQMFDEIGEREKAATYYERTGNFARAFELWQTLGRKEEALRCRIELLKKDKNYGELANIYLRQKYYPQACEMLERDRQYRKAAEVATKFLKNPAKAAALFERAGDHSQAARLYKKLGEWEKAATLYERAGETDEAIKLWKKLKRTDRLMRLYEKVRDYEALLRIYEKKRDLDTAVKILRKMGGETDWVAEGDRLFAARKYFPALVRYTAAGHAPGRAECLMKMRMYEDAAKYFEQAGQTFRAGEAYQKAKKFKQAYLCFLASEEEAQADYSRAKRLRWKLLREDLFAITEYLVDKKDYARAKKHFQVTGDPTMAGVMTILLGNEQEAYEIWANATLHDPGFYEYLAGVCMEFNLIDQGAHFVLHYQDKAERAVVEADLWTDRIACPNLLTMMDEYFRRKERSKEEYLLWARCFVNYGLNEMLHFKKLTYFVKAEAYVHYFHHFLDLVLRKSAYSNYREKTPEDILAKLKKQFNSDPILTAFHDFLDGSLDRFHAYLDSTAPDARNYFLFLLDGRCENVDDFVSSWDIMVIKKYFREVKASIEKWLALAQLAERHQVRPIFAAEIYLQAGAYEDAARLFAKEEEYSKAAGCLEKAGKYEQAIAMYEKSGKNKQKIARLYEKLGQWREAAEIWKALGKPKQYQRCMKHSDMPNLFDGEES
ncbi:MAG: UvrD-helicase domain-containing protein [candidate division KSB1 bacterium]|nr:UvrD-helicase domain-containing protein [candidate division KSB1 bacterium]